MSDSNAPHPIAFCITGLQPGGAERALVQIVTRLNRERWDPVVYSLTGSGPLVEPLQQAGISTETLQARSAWDARIIWHLAQKFKAQSYFTPIWRGGLRPGWPISRMSCRESVCRRSGGTGICCWID